MKPADFFLGVVNFLGVLVPGAVLLYLRVPPAVWSLARDAIPPWLVFGGFSYLIGQLLLAVTELLNDRAEPAARLIFSTLHKDLEEFRKRAITHCELLRIGSRQARFHTALSYLRTQRAEAAAEVDHHMADYKLLRNLLAVLSIDLIARASVVSPQIGILILEGVLLVACFIAFVRMFCWAELLGFQYVCLITKEKAEKTTESI
jgi:hypothetical protein